MYRLNIKVRSPPIDKLCREHREPLGSWRAHLNPGAIPLSTSSRDGRAPPVTGPHPHVPHRPSGEAAQTGAPLINGVARDSARATVGSVISYNV